MPTGTRLTRAELTTLRNRARLHAAARNWVLLLEQENKALKQRLNEQEQKTKELERKLKEMEKKLAAQEDANRKLRSMLFVRQKPHRTRRVHDPVPRSAASYRRARPTEITERKTLAIANCPDCAEWVSAPQSSRTRIVEDIVLQPKPSVIEWTITRHYCAQCKKLVQGTVPGVLPWAKIGPNTMAYVLVAKYRWHLPYAKIGDALSISFGLAISEGEIANILEKAAELLGAKWNDIVSAVASGKTVHCDETSWYIDGKKAWTHCFTTTEAVLYEILPTRGKGVAEARLGADFSGTRVTDCLPNYKNLPGKHQICWAHLTREAGENADREPENKERKRVAEATSGIYGQLRMATADWKEREAAKARAMCETVVAGLTKKQWRDPASRKLVHRLQEFHHALFTCLDAPGIPPDNNHAERALRKIVVQRKISGGNRSPTHAAIHAKLMSVMETLRLEEGDLLADLQTLLRGGIATRLSGG